MVLNENLDAASKWFEDIMNETRDHFLRNSNKPHLWSEGEVG
jgi:hypothetical protein